MATVPCVPKYVEAGTIDMTAIPKHEYYGCVTRAEARAAIDSLWDSGVTLPSVRYQYVGTALYQVVNKATGALTLQAALAAFASLAGALAVMRRKKLVHMDISVHNVTVVDRPEGRPPLFMLIDFEYSGLEDSRGMHHNLQHRAKDQHFVNPFLLPELPALAMVMALCRIPNFRTLLQALHHEIDEDVALEIAESFMDKLRAFKKDRLRLEEDTTALQYLTQSCDRLFDRLTDVSSTLPFARDDSFLIGQSMVGMHRAMSAQVLHTFARMLDTLRQHCATTDPKTGILISTVLGSFLTEMAQAWDMHGFGVVVAYTIAKQGASTQHPPHTAIFRHVLALLNTHSFGVPLAARGSRSAFRDLKEGLAAIAATAAGP